ncbi:N-acetyl-gamma-glutamyl-phosphate reductase [Heyndrickxia camelliae]|uniref:N-acetyl-gamma-glutamyl-phosphate reductase n=1 Tax=Heyndrickxia camelliae TaxID=1707093 RepID=A0A2N3LFF7_9BACI|nr:N-acetyl-gamma-glutamyl-phosphate reductase [Heyndrickxia camelliae]PKR83274.1 N-acetyl-gamma-glutamyl-phosphate reductase [Heyndrickxia camelliae]
MKIGIIGANGYGGAELIRLLHQHPKVEIEMLISNSTKGTVLTDQYKHLHNIIEMPLEEWNPNKIQSKLDVLFFATPSGVSKEMLPSLLESEITCIDLSGDFRLKSEGLYEKWYKNKSAHIEDLQKSTYGLTELNRNEIKNSKFIANPGCYPTATLLGLAPVLKANVIDMNSIIIDGKSGVSGAGRKPSVGNLFSEVNENVTAYKLGTHQHIPEIEQEIQNITGISAAVTFTTHLIPMTRGIMCTIYADLKQKVNVEEILELYREAYKDDGFIRIRPKDNWPSTKEVYSTNYCDIGINIEERTGRLTIISVIDNLVKGAAGQAIQNLNVIAGWDERTGLAGIPIYP